MRMNIRSPIRDTDLLMVAQQDGHQRGLRPRQAAGPKYYLYDGSLHGLLTSPSQSGKAVSVVARDKLLTGSKMLTAKTLMESAMRVVLSQTDRRSPVSDASPLFFIGLQTSMFCKTQLASLSPQHETLGSPNCT